MKSKPADIIREYGPFPGVSQVHGVSYDGKRVWIAVGEKLHALDPVTGAVVQSIDVAAQAGTAFDGQHLYQIAGDVIQKIDPASGRILGTIPAPHGEGNSGMAWAEGMLWVGRYKDRTILQVDPATGAILRTIASDRYVTGVTWVDGGLWHGTWEDDASELRHVDPQSGEVLESLALPKGMVVSGLESDGGDVFYCGGATSGKLRAVRKPRAVA